MSERVPPGTIRIGRIVGVEVRVSSSWLLVAALIAVVVAPRVEQVAPGLGALKYVAGLAFAVLLYLSVLLHEASHAVAARRFGLPVRSITLHFLGGATELGAEPRTARAELVIAVVGPLTSIAVGIGALGLLIVGPEGGLLRMALEALAAANIAVGVLNLVPGLPLDGGRVLKAALWGMGAGPHRATIVAAWGGRVAAVLALAWPLFLELVLDRRADLADVLVAFVMATFLWTGASASLVHARLRSRLPAVTARGLARRVVLVPDSVTVADAVRRATEAQAGGIAVLDPAGGQVAALVTEASLRAVPDERRPWLPVGQVARTMEDGLRVPAGLEGESLLEALGRTPASEYLVIEPDGSVFGVLSAGDVHRALTAAPR